MIQPRLDFGPAPDLVIRWRLGKLAAAMPRRESGGLVSCRWWAAYRSWAELLAVVPVPVTGSVRVRVIRRRDGEQEDERGDR